MCHILRPLLYLESAEDSSHPAVQAVPAPVAFVDHCFELAGSVGPVLSGQAAVLVIDQFKLGEPLVNLSLDTLKRIGDLAFVTITGDSFCQFISKENSKHLKGNHGYFQFKQHFPKF